MSAMLFEQWMCVWMYIFVGIYLSIPIFAGYILLMSNLSGVITFAILCTTVYLLIKQMLDVFLLQASLWSCDDSAKCIQKLMQSFSLHWAQSTISTKCPFSKENLIVFLLLLFSISWLLKLSNQYHDPVNLNLSTVSQLSKKRKGYLSSSYDINWSSFFFYLYLFQSYFYLFHFYLFFI